MKNILFGVIGCVAIIYYYTSSQSNPSSIYSSVSGHLYPDYPAIAQEAQIQAVNEDKPNYYNSSFLPAHRSTADGRIAVPSSRADYLDKFYLNVPENFDQKIPFTSPHSPSGTSILAREGGAINFKTFDIEDLVNSHNTKYENTSDSESFAFGQTSICDASMQFPEDQTSPVSCGSESVPADCYTFILTASFSEREKNNGLLGGYGNFKRTVLYGRKVKVIVTNPKTTQALIDSFSWVGEPIKGFEFNYTDPNFTTGNPPMLEPTFTNDGRLLVFRTGPLTISWRQNNGSMKEGKYNMLYAVAPESASACDISAYEPLDLAPLSHAYNDNSMKVGNISTGVPRYGIAEYQLRDPQGNLISDGDDLQGTYPWIDRDGANMMIETIGANLYSTNYDHTPRFEVKCLEDIDCDAYPTDLGKNGDIQWAGKKRGVTFFGRWTRGKMVLLDGLVNNTDFGQGQQQKNQRRIKLYEPNTDSDHSRDGYVNAGFGQGIAISKSTSETYGVDKNASFIDSVENLFAHYNAFVPYSFRDITWLVTGGRTTAEVMFDDYIDHHAYIVSEMTAAQEHTRNVTNFEIDPMILYDGFEDSTSQYNEPRRLQNASSTLQFRIPPYGTLNGKARIEPIAMGGIQGRGVFLHGASDSIEYIIPDSNKKNEWIISLFIDPRDSAGKTKRRLITYPDKTKIDLIGRNELKFSIADSGTLLTANFPPNNSNGSSQTHSWSHIGIQIKNSKTGSLLTVFIDGLPVVINKHFEQQLFRMLSPNGDNTLSIGQGYRGWVDEFKIFAHGGNYEYMCNLAKGTLIGFENNVQPGWWNSSLNYPQSTYAAISLALDSSKSYNNYACFHDYTEQKRAHRSNLPNNTFALSNSFHFPEGPLKFSRPRPNSVNSKNGGAPNSFCLTCHMENDVAPSMDISNALGVSNVNLEDDPRRQPMQPPRNIYGYIPKDFYQAYTENNLTVPTPSPFLPI